MFSLYILAVVLMVVLTLQVLIIPKPKSPEKRNIEVVVRKKIRSIEEPEKLLINGHTEISLWDGGFFGCFQQQFWVK